MITFKNREYKIVKEIPVTDLLASEGLVKQLIIEGQRGATRLLQEYSNGIRKTVSLTGRVETELTK